MATTWQEFSQPFWEKTFSKKNRAILDLGIKKELNHFFYRNRTSPKFSKPRKTEKHLVNYPNTLNKKPINSSKIPENLTKISDFYSENFVIFTNILVKIEKESKIL